MVGNSHVKPRTTMRGSTSRFDISKKNIFFGFLLILLLLVSFFLFSSPRLSPPFENYAQDRNSLSSSFESLQEEYIQKKLAYDACTNALNAEQSIVTSLGDQKYAKIRDQSEGVDTCRSLYDAVLLLYNTCLDLSNKFNFLTTQLQDLYYEYARLIDEQNSDLSLQEEQHRIELFQEDLDKEYRSVDTFCRQIKSFS